MKKFLLVAAAAIVAVSANAQFVKEQTAVKAQVRHQALPTAAQKKYEVAGLKTFEALNHEMKMMSKKFDMNKAQSFKAVSKFKAASVQAQYNAKGYQATNDSLMQWTMKSETAAEGGATLLVNVLPDPFESENGVAVEYTLSDNTITILPQIVASNEDKTMFVFLESATSSDGVITLTLNDDGTIAGNYSILYGAYDGEDYATAKYLGWYGYYAKNISYKVPGQKVVAPQVEYQPNSLVLYAGLGVSGYSYNDNLVLMGAYGPVSFRNSTVDDATAWDWSATQIVSDDEPAVKISGTDKDFTINTIGGAVYENVALVGINEDQKSDSVKWGVGKTLRESDGSVRYTALHAYAGSTASSFAYSDGTTAIMTTQDPDGDLTFYTNWATPDKASNSMSKIYVYQGKPSTPIYFEGVVLPMVGFEAKEGFNLHIAIRKCTRNPQTGRVALGDIVAQADATIDDVDASYAETSGLTNVNFTSFYVEDEWGLSEDVDYLFMDEEFLIEIDGWDNGTFTGVLGTQDITPNNALTTTWFEMTGEEGSMYSYTTWKCSLFVGLIEATYGYLYTTDPTTFAIANEGGEAKMHIKPMLTSKDQDNNTTYRLFVKDIVVDGEEVEEVPEWLTFGVANEDYTILGEDEQGYTIYGPNYSEYDLVAQVAALPDGVEGRKAEVTFFQEGALLKVTVLQGSDASGISKTTVTKTASDGKLYDLNGRQVSTGNKGLFILDGKKYIVK